MKSLWSSLLNRDASDPEDTLLSAIPLFEDLTPREIDAVQRLLHRRDYVAGESVFVQGEPGLGMYIISRGVVSIQSEPSGRELVELRDGDFFGEIALLQDVPRTATVSAATAARLHALERDDFLAIVTGNAVVHTEADAVATQRMEDNAAAARGEQGRGWPDGGGSA